MADIVQKITVPEEDLLLLNRLQLNSELFTRQLDARREAYRLTTDSPLRLDMVDGRMRFVLEDHGKEIPFLECTFRHLGNSAPAAPEELSDAVEGERALVWIWDRELLHCLTKPTLPTTIPSTSGSPTEEESVQLPGDLLRPVLVTNDGMLVSFLLGRLTAMLGLEHVYTRTRPLYHRLATENLQNPTVPAEECTLQMYYGLSDLTWGPLPAAGQKVQADAAAGQADQAS